MNLYMDDHRWIESQGEPLLSQPFRLLFSLLQGLSLKAMHYTYNAKLNAHPWFYFLLWCWSKKEKKKMPHWHPGEPVKNEKEGGWPLLKIPSFTQVISNVISTTKESLIFICSCWLHELPLTLISRSARGHCRAHTDLHFSKPYLITSSHFLLEDVFCF